MLKSPQTPFHHSYRTPWLFFPVFTIWNSACVCKSWLPSSSRKRPEDTSIFACVCLVFFWFVCFCFFANSCWEPGTQKVHPPFLSSDLRYHLSRSLEGGEIGKDIKSVGLKGNQPWIGMTDAETPILWPPDWKNWLSGKDPDAGSQGKKKNAKKQNGCLGRLYK